MAKAKADRFEVRMNIDHVDMDGTEYDVFTHPDFPDILVTASNPQSFAEWLAFVMVEALPNLNIQGFTVLRVKQGARSSFPRVFKSDEDGDRGA